MDSASVIHPDDRALIFSAERTAIESNRPLHVQARLLHKYGHYVSFDIHGSHTGSREDGTMYLSLTDMTELLTAQRLLEKRDEELRYSIINSGLMICSYSFADKSLSVIDETAAKYDVFSFMPNACEALLEGGYIAPESSEAWREMFSSIERGESGSVEELCIKGVHGGWRWYSANYSEPIGVGEEKSVAVSLLDITDKHKLKADYASFSKAAEDRRLSSLLLVKIDLTKDTILQLEDHSAVPFGSIAAGESYSQSLKQIVAHHFVEDDRDVALSILGRNALLGQYADGVRKLSEVNSIHFMSDGLVHRVRFDVRLAEDVASGNIITFWSVKDLE